MDASLAQAVVSGVGLAPRGHFRGRGGSGAMRGSFDRGRGRGMQGGRGAHFMGGMGRGGIVGMGIGMAGPPPPPQSMMMGGRGMRPRGGLGFPGRGFPPRTGIHARGGRQPIYTQPIKQHTGAENNKTVSPVTTTATTKTTTQVSSDAIGITGATANNTQQGNTNSTQSATSSATVTQADSAPNAPTVSTATTNGGTSVSHQNYTRGSGRGRSNQYPAGTGSRGGYNQYPSPRMYGTSAYPGSQNSDPNQMGMRRGSMQRGRGGYGQSMPRPQMHQQHVGNSQTTAVPPIKRGAPGGPGPKRGRYEGGPYTQRPIAPKYHQQQQHTPQAIQPPHSGYGIHQAHHHQQQQSHHGYQVHDSSQAPDPYIQSYAQPSTQTAYNGYGQNGAYATHPQAPPPANVSYATHHTTEYDQTQYQNYGGSNYGAQQDTRYQGYGQDYTQQYGAPAVDYNQAQQADYAQQSASGYDERAYSGYDAQSYQQNYSNAAGYY